MHTTMYMGMENGAAAYLPKSLVAGNWEISLNRSITEAYQLLYAPHSSVAALSILVHFTSLSWGPKLRIIFF
jgi:hypothetical protein